MSENDEILSIALEIKKLLNTGADADAVNNKIGELKRFVETDEWQIICSNTDDRLFYGFSGLGTS